MSTDPMSGDRVRELTAFLFASMFERRKKAAAAAAVVVSPSRKRKRDESDLDWSVTIEEDSSSDEPPAKLRRIQVWSEDKQAAPALPWHKGLDQLPDWVKHGHLVRETYTGPTFGNREIEFWSHSNGRNEHERCKDIEFFGGFDDPTVHYYVIDGLRGGYTSVTSFLHLFFADFELVKYERAQLCTRGARNPTGVYFGMETVERVLGFWDTNRDNGTCKHAAIDDHLQGRPLRPVYQCGASDPIGGPPLGYYHFMADHPDLVPYFTEFSVFDRDLCICGQFDALFWDTRRLCFVLVDWKNVLNFKTSNPSEKGVHPLTANMDDCHKVQYTLQLNIYRSILEKHYGFKVREMWIVNFPPREQAEGAYMKIIAERIDMVPFFAQCPVTEEGKARLALWGGEQQHVE